MKDGYYLNRSALYPSSLPRRRDNLVILIDEKAKVPIRITAAIKQVPTVMHMIYEIRFLDHEFVVTTSCKVTPSGYAACEITRCSSKRDFNHKVDQCRLLFRVVRMIIAQLIRMVEILTIF